MVRQEGTGYHNPVERALSSVAHSYQGFCDRRVLSDLTNPKFFDDIAGAYDVDAIGSHPCTHGGNRGLCYQGEAMATAGSYTLALYGEKLNPPLPKPLFLTILDDS